MYNINILIEHITNSFKDESLFLIFLISILCAIYVVISKNPILSVLFLIGLYLSISGYLVLLGLTFIGISYLLVYVGAVSILFLFILMLINIRISEIITDTNNSIPLALLISSFIFINIYYILPYNNNMLENFIYNFLSLIIKNYNDNNNEILYTDINFYNLINKNDEVLYEDINYNNSITDEILYVTSNTWDEVLIEISHITNIGNIMYTSYSIWLIITSIILLLAMIGSIAITIKK